MLALLIPGVGMGAGGTVVAAPEVAQTPAGKKRRRRYVVVVDNQEFMVSSVTEARNLLAQAASLAERKAPIDVKRREVSAIKIELPTISTPAPQLREVVLEANERIAEIYQEAEEQERRVRTAVRRAAEQDEEEAIISLLLH